MKRAATFYKTNCIVLFLGFLFLANMTYATPTIGQQDILTQETESIIEQAVPTDPEKKKKKEETDKKDPEEEGVLSNLREMLQDAMGFIYGPEETEEEINKKN